MKRNSPLKVLQFAHLINRYDFMDVLIRHANKLKFEMMACTFTDESNIQNPEYAKDGYQHEVLDLPFSRYGFFTAIFKLSRIIRRDKIDIVHANHYYESLIACLAIILAGGGNLIVSRHYHNELYITTKGLKLKLYLLLEKFVNRRACAIISPSTLITQLLTEQGVKPEKIVWIPYGFDFKAPKYKATSSEEIDTFRATLGIKNDEILLGNFGRHHPIKAQDLLLQSFSRILKDFNKIKLIMVGDGPFHKTLLHVAEDLNIRENVIFYGWQRNINAALSAVDIVWHPTNQEAFPQIMIEAMAMQKPLFITPVSGATDMIVNGSNGFLIPFRDVEAWTQTLLYACNNRPKLQAIGIKAKETVTQKLDISSIIKKVERVYEQCA